MQSPHQVCNVQSVVGCSVCIHEKHISRWFGFMPASGVAREDEDIVAKKHGRGRQRDLRSFLAGQAAASKRWKAAEIEHVRIANPLEKRVRKRVLSTLVRRTGHDLFVETVMVEGPVNAVEEIGLAGIEIGISAARPNKPIHSVDGDIVIGPE